MNTNLNCAIQLRDVRYTWPKRDTETINITELNIPLHHHVFIQGPSGSGKSTLLSLLTGIIQPQSGEIQLLEQDLSNLSHAQRDKFRSDHIGYIFQHFNLLPYLSVIDNVLLPCRFSALRRQKIHQQSMSPKQQAIALLERLHLPKTAFERSTSELSVGQQQRVAAARALIGQPELIIADEPTSALDYDNRQAFIELLLEEADRSEATVIFVSHDASLKAHFKQHIELTQLNLATQEVLA